MTTTVIGGTGKTGGRVARRLTALGQDVRIASRSVSGFDWDDPRTWDAAVRGARAAYVTYAPDLAVPGAADRVAGFADRAVLAGCTRLVLLSGRGEPAAQHAEKLVADCGAAVTIVRAAFFAQNFSESFLQSAVVAGEIALPAGDVGEPFVDCDDVADVVVAALTDERHVGQIYEVTGPAAVGFDEAAATLSAALGRQVTYQPVSVEEFRAGLPPEVPGDIADLLGFIFDGHNAHVTHGVHQALHREPRSFATFVADAAATGVWA